MSVEPLKRHRPKGETSEDHGDGCFSLLPENCIAEIISKTSVKDACRSSAVSLDFKSASESDSVWLKFLPPDYQHILDHVPVDHPVRFATTKKELFFLLCDSNILLNHADATLSLWLCKKSGKKCYMLRARDLSIAWQDNPTYWVWIPFPESRFSEAGKLRYVWWFDIGGKIEAKILSPKTSYAAYVVYKVYRNSSGLDSAAESSVKYVGDDENADVHDRVHLVTPIENEDDPGMRQMMMRVPQMRMDGWMEIYLGSFYNDHGVGEIEMKLSQTESFIKSGIILEGIEVRPI